MRGVGWLAFVLLIGGVNSLPAQEGGPSVPLARLMPMPAAVKVESGRLGLDKSFRVGIANYRDARLERAIRRMLVRLEAQTGTAFARDYLKDAAQATLVVEVRGAGEAVQSIAEDESYSLKINSRQAVLEANTVVGALRGLETLLQLVESDPDGYYISLADIEDKPRFAWRGLLIDVCRHWEPVEVIKRNLDAMAAVKLNVLHWHLSEDQGFRVESKSFPKLQELGSDGHYYTQEQVREVVAYARDRGIRVVPEFDMPGHATSWMVAYPQYASAPGPYEIIREFGVFPATFDPTREATFKFIDRFIGKMAKLFPDAYWHIGGDEVMGKQWNENPKIQEFKKRRGFKTNEELQAYFNQRLNRILRKHGKKMVGWDEILHPDLPKDVVVQSWRGQESLGKGAKQGYYGILSAGYYLDGMQTSAAMYAVDPLPAGNGLSPEEAARVLGGEICMWGELITPENIDSRLWPRTAAIAERLWSPREVNNVGEMYRRLDATSLFLEQAGAKHIAGPDRMLRQLAETDDIEPLRELLRLVEPLSLGQRQSASRANQLTPLTELADIALPDAPGRHEVMQMVDELLGDAPGNAARAKLETEFRRWRELREQLDAMAKDAPRVRAADAAMVALVDLAAAGDEALAYLARGEKAPKEWLDAKLALVQQAGRPKGLLRLAVVPAMRRLIEAAGEMSRL